MKYKLILFFALFSLTFSAQQLPKDSKIFVRVFNENDNKIAKGRLVEITHNFIKLKKGNRIIMIPSSSVFYIKTKRSKGHNILIGSLIGAAIPIISANQTANNFDSFLHYLLTPVIASIGAGFGYLTTIFKKSKTYFIFNNQKKWQEFKDAMYSPQK